jgi:hypothetical protein
MVLSSTERSKLKLYKRNSKEVKVERSFYLNVRVVKRAIYIG